MYRTPQELGSFDAKECPRPAMCLATAGRLWLVSTTHGGQPLSGMPKATAGAIESGFHVVRTRKLTGLRLVLLERTRKTTDGPAGEDDASRRKVHL
jgi:mannosyltransferase